MKTTVVPAQITTVEDKIAGSLTFVQIMLLVMALIFGTVLYATIPPRLHLSTFKIILVILQFMFFGGLAIRINGKILADWLIVYLRFASRPRIYIFTKNDLNSRDVPIEVAIIKKSREMIKEQAGEQDEKETKPVKNIEYRNMLDHSAMTISVKPSKKGGLDVSLRKI